MTFAWGHALPTLPTPRLALRQLTPADAGDIFAIFSDPEVMRFWDHGPMRDVAAAETYVAAIQEGLRNQQLFQWGTWDPAERRIVGTCTLLHVSTVHERGEIGFAVARAHWGRGVATEAVSALIAFCFEQLELHRLEADVDPRNERSLRLLERLGFRREGLLRERYFVDGERQDTVILGLLRTEWNARS
jgi:[ribosomal protein S5]-alanine N-acetyltransferase